MAAGLIQLVARGIQDKYLVSDPEITFFKVVYRRHTNFSLEPIKHLFTDKPEFGKKVTCTVSKQSDLIRKMHLVVTLPSIPKFKNTDGTEDTVKKVAWVRRVGFAIIKEVEIEVGNEIIDKQYGEWLHIWYELTQRDNKDLSVILGDVPRLTEYTNGKSEYKLFIPLQFWFNRHAGVALPTAALEHNQVKIHLELTALDKLLLATPTHYIEVEDDLISLTSGEYIEQQDGNNLVQARFIHFDSAKKRLYLQRMSDFSFNGKSTKAHQREIKGLTSSFTVTIKESACEKKVRNRSVDLTSLQIKDAYLLVEHVYLDIDERVRLTEGNHEYLVEQLQFNGDQTVDGLHQMFKLGFTGPTKELFWVTQLDSANRLNQTFNYTDSLINYGDGTTEEFYECTTEEKQLSCCTSYKTVRKGKDLIKNATVLFNGQERLSERDSCYFGKIQPYQHHTNTPATGINSYSFSVHPEEQQPSGTANLTKVEDVRLKIEVKGVNAKRKAKIRIYSVSLNTLRVSTGISGLVFATERG